MLGKTHQAVGILAGLALTNYVFTDVPLLKEIPMVTLSALGSLLPDVDLHNSKFTNRFPNLSYVIKGYSATCTVGFGDANYTSSLLSHRGISHSVFILLPIFIFLSVLMSHICIVLSVFGASLLIGDAVSLYLQLFFFLMVGILSHILFDLLTINGVRLLAPFSNKVFSLIPLHTGGFLEGVLRVFIVFLNCFILLQRAVELMGVVL